MRDQLVQYVSLLFAGNEEAEDMKQEILQNTLDRFDDLIAQGKSPEAAYRLAITGIGDINEILNGTQDYQYTSSYSGPAYREEPTFTGIDLGVTRVIRSIAICLYILCPIPVILLDQIGLDVLGVCGTFAIIAVATALILIFRSPKKTEEPTRSFTETEPNTAFYKSLAKLISTIGLVLYIIVSFSTNAWHITWVIFPLTAAVNGLVKACLDLKERV